MKPAALIIAAALAAWTPTAWADEAVRTHAGEAPAPEAAAAVPAASDAEARQADGDWARKVMDRAANPDKAAADDAKKGCERNPDRQPHGEVWAGVGTGGYRNAGAVVTQPIGDCGQATVAINHTEYGQGRSGGRRR